ncbi:MAG: hypothetical protein QM296_12395 [Bacillota bacterium]|nr:hypothetical protein [Bacillota bacterium]
MYWDELRRLAGVFGLAAVKKAHSSFFLTVYFAIRPGAEGCTVYGVPWDRKEQLFCNVERPLHVILEVRCASFTRLRRLSADQAYRILIHQCFVPMWDEDTAVLAMSNGWRLCSTVPIYRLFCGSGAKAALKYTRRFPTALKKYRRI